MSAIKDILARKIYDSRGSETLEVEVILENARGRASVPAGASTGSKEVFKLTDIKKSIANIEAFKNSLIGQDSASQEKIDLLLINTDGTTLKKNLGGNVILAISLAVCQATANEQKLSLYKYLNQISGIKIDKFTLPTPLFNIINGGKHSDSNLPFQEFMVVPHSEISYSQKLEQGVKIFHILKKELKEMNMMTNVGDEGGFAPELNTNEEAMEVVLRAIEKSGYKPATEVSMALDVAASSIADLNAITYPLSPIDYYEKITNEYPILILEDPLSEDDWEGWKKITNVLGSRVKIVGDDIFTTNAQILKKGIDMGVANSVLVKPDQIGTLSETFNTIRVAKASNYDVIISHRSGETESTFISDLAVAVGAQYIKTGAPNRGERIAKYNQLLRIEEELNMK